MPPFTLLLIIALALILFVFMLTSSSLRIVPEYKRLVIFRLGRLIGARGPGLVLLLPFIDLAASVDLREQTAQIKLDGAATEDNAIVDVEMLLSYKVLTPVKIATKLADAPLAIKTAATRVLQDVLQQHAYTDLLYSRERIGADVFTRLDATVKDWGIEITGVELSEPHKRQSV